MKNNSRSDACLTLRFGKTTYIVGICFKEDTKETIDDKIRKMIREEIKRGESA